MLSAALDRDRSGLRLTLQQARRIATNAGVDLSSVTDERRFSLESAATSNFSTLSHNDKYRTVRIMVEELSALDSARIHKRLEDLGFMFAEGHLVAINLLDSAES